jgi:hypothetical protein
VTHRAEIKIREFAKEIAADVEFHRARRATLIDAELAGRSSEEREAFRLALLDELAKATHKPLAIEDEEEPT